MSHFTDGLEEVLQSSAQYATPGRLRESDGTRPCELTRAVRHASSATPSDLDRGWTINEH
jgi:hypothetical protein